jgi:tight adherence protein C
MTGALADLAIAIVLGTGFGLGTWCLLALSPRWGAASLAARIGPYVRDVADPRGATPWRHVGPGWASAWSAARAGFARALGGAESVQRRLAKAGRPVDATAFRGRQLAWALGGVVAGGAVLVALAVLGRFGPAAALVPFVTGGIVLVACDALLSSAARARARRIEEELPTVLEFLALCLSAGEGLLDSLRRVGSVAAGDLTREIRTAVLAVGTGSSLSDALVAMAGRVQVPALARSVDHLVAALERGAPLAQVLQAQAADAREDAKRALIEQAGRKEILMLLPLVFLVLPLSVVFAVFPGVFMLRLGLG